MERIDTKRLALVPPDHSWASIIQQVSWLNNRSVVQYSQQRHVKHTIESQMRYVENFTPPHTFMEILLKLDYEKPIGTISAIFDEINSIADVGILIGDKSEWGNGYGLEAWRAFCDSLNVRKIEAGCDHRNIAMIKIFREYGMSFEGRRRLHFVNDNGIHSDAIYFGKVKE